jgi:TolB protein
LALAADHRSNQTSGGKEAVIEKVGFAAIAICLIAASAFSGSSKRSSTAPKGTDLQATPTSIHFEGEKHLGNIKQLTFQGENAEAYFSFDGNKLIFQSTRDTFRCDQIFTMNADGNDVKLVSNGKGRTTCAYFFPNEDKILYSSTFLSGTSCPPRPDYSQGYVWPLYDSYEIFKADINGANPFPLTKTPGYDAEATIAPDGSSIVFTSCRDGDLELYLMDPDGKNQIRLTHDIGYDGGAFFGPDSRRIVYRAHHPKDEKEIQQYEMLLKKGLIKPNVLEIFIINRDGTGRFQVTDFHAASFCPFFAPDGKRIIFSSNLSDPKGHNFDLYIIDADGSNLERITYCPSFDGFPMFSHDGKKLVFGSNRNSKERYETNIFIADWIP